MNLKPILMTMGDPNGIGPEICLRLTSKKQLKSERPVGIVGDFQVLCAAQDLLRTQKKLIRIQKPEEIFEAAKLGIPVLDAGESFREKINPGKISKKAGKASIAWVDAAARWCLAGRASAMVTAPLCKESVEKTVPGFQGHTEYIGNICADPEPVLALVHGAWVVAHISTHVSLREACDRVTPERILKVGILLNDFLKRYKNKKNPKIGIAGLNPHAGEHGLFGNEEIQTIIPAVKTLNQKKITVKGPVPADVIFPQLKNGLWDGVIAMYHDQGHIVTKTMLFDLGKVRKTAGVNTTLGLPIVRMSVDHGTGFDIAWKGIASGQSLKDAFELACMIRRGEP